jgi:pimeloyl-ACP methyl ester carboxylesterase
VPNLRGFSPAYSRPNRHRVRQQIAIGRDVLNLVETLALKAQILVGYDWGGRAATALRLNTRSTPLKPGSSGCQV